MIELIVAFLLGVIFTILIALLAAVAWVYSKPLVASKPPGFGLYVRPELPRGLEQLYEQVNSNDGAVHVNVESCDWFNVILDFIFRELRDSPVTQRLVRKKINKEFAEVMLTKTEGKMIEQLTVREYSLGSSLPVFSNITVMGKRYGEEDAEGESRRMPMEIDIAGDVEYSGGFYLAIDADLVFNKTAYVSIQVLWVKGRGRLRFSREPVTHWSFSFVEDPHLDLKVESHFEGRNFPQLSSFIQKQVRKWVKRKHTLPSYKARFKPFFRRPKPQDQLLDVYVHDDGVTVGELRVEVVECTRLFVMEEATSTYCTLSVASTPWQPVVGLWKTQWPVHEIMVKKDGSCQTVGITHAVVSYEEEHNLVLISEVTSESPAYAAGVKKGDVLIRVNNVRVASTRQVNRLFQKSKGDSLLVTVQRPPPHFAQTLLHQVSLARPKREKQKSAAEVPIEPHSGKEQTLKKNPVSRSYFDGHGMSFAAEYSKGLLSTCPSLCDHYVTEESYSYRPRSQSRDSSPVPDGIPTRKIDEDSISLCGVMGERRLEEGGGMRRRRQSPLMTTQNMEEEPDEVSVTGADLLPSLASHLSSSPLEECDAATPTLCESVDGEGKTGGMAQTSSEVMACRHPVWNEPFKFEVKEDHRYLNICVWNKLREGRGDLLIGHATISLMDVALECVSTSSGTHHQRYVLVAAQAAKAGASRATLHATSSSGKGTKKKEDEPPFAGDIFLRFQHTSHLEERDSEEKEETFHSEEPGPSHHHPFMPVQGYLPSEHQFIPVEAERAQKCDICYKKVWGLKSRVQECQKCGLKCHKRCARYCMKEVTCYRRHGVDVNHLHQTMDGDFAIYGDDEDSGLENGNGHRHLEQRQDTWGRDRGLLQRNSDPEDLTQSGGFSDGSTPRPKELHSHGSLPRLPSDGSTPRPREINSDGDSDDLVDGGSNLPQLGQGYTDSDTLMTTPNSDSDLEQAVLEQASYSLFTSLPTSDREALIRRKISDIQSEIDRISEWISMSVKDLRSSGCSPEEKQRIKERIAHYKDTLQPMKLLMKQHSLALNHCTANQ